MPEPEPRPEQEPEPEPVRVPDRPARRPPPELPEDIEELKAELLRAREASQRLHKDATANRRRLEELEDAERKREEARLTETERLQKQLKEESTRRAAAEAQSADMTARLKQTIIDREIEQIASEMDFEEPLLTPRLVDPALVGMDEDGKVSGVREALKKLADKHKSLLRPKPSGGTPIRDVRSGRPPKAGESDEIKNQLIATGRYAPY